MNPGELRNLVEIQILDNQSDEMGGEVQNWSTSYMAWAKIEPSSNYYYAHFQESGKERLRITIRYLDLNMDKVRIQYRNKNYKINSFDNIDMKNEYLVIDCEEE